MIYTFVSSINNIFVHWLTSQCRCSSPQVHVFSWRFSTRTSTPDIFLTSSSVSLPGCSSQTDSSSAHGGCLFHFILFHSDVSALWQTAQCGWSRNDTPAQQTLTQLIIHLFMVSAHFLFQPNVDQHQTVFSLNHWAFSYRVWIDRTNRKVGKFKTLWLGGFLGSFILSLISIRRQILRYLQQMLYIYYLFIFVCASDFVPIHGSHV